MEITAILEGFYLYKVVSEYAKSILYHVNVLGEYAKNILPYMEITPIDIKLSLSRRIFEQNRKTFRS
jgi:hypothetical protein